MYRDYQNDKIVYNLLDDKINKFLYKYLFTYRVTFFRWNEFVIGFTIDFISFVIVYRLLRGFGFICFFRSGRSYLWLLSRSFWRFVSCRRSCRLSNLGTLSSLNIIRRRGTWWLCPVRLRSKQ